MHWIHLGIVSEHSKTVPQRKPIPAPDFPNKGKAQLEIGILGKGNQGNWGDIHRTKRPNKTLESWKRVQKKIREAEFIRFFAIGCFRRLLLEKQDTQFKNRRCFAPGGRRLVKMGRLETTRCCFLPISTTLTKALNVRYHRVIFIVFIRTPKPFAYGRFTSNKLHCSNPFHLLVTQLVLHPKPKGGSMKVP